MKDAPHKKQIMRFMKKKKMKSKVMHGQYIISKVRQLISEEGMFL
jgi:nucleoside diphosphate kinase